MDTKHKAVKCSVRGCKEEAGFWIPTRELSGDFDIKKETFFLCDEHAEELSYLGEYEEIRFLNPETGKIRSIELGVYSCSDGCRICNQ